MSWLRSFGSLLMSRFDTTTGKSSFIRNASKLSTPSSKSWLPRVCKRRRLSLSLPSSKSTFSQLFKEKCMSEVVIIGSIIIFDLRKLWKAKSFKWCNSREFKQTRMRWQCEKPRKNCLCISLKFLPFLAKFYCFILSNYTHVRHDDPEIMSISHFHVFLLSSAISLFDSLTLPSWSPVLWNVLRGERLSWHRGPFCPLLRSWRYSET